MTRRAIVTSVHPPDQGLAVGSHHVARELARRGWEVALLSDPASLTHLAMAPFHAGARRRVAAAALGWREIAPRLTACTPLTLAPLAGRFGAGSPFLIEHWLAATAPPLLARLRRAGFGTPDLAMFDGALYAPILDRLRIRRSVARMFDHPDGRPFLPPALRAREMALLRRCDLTAATAVALMPLAEELGARRTHLFENGVDPDHFSTPAPAPAEYAAIPPPRAVYVGAIESWVDQALVAAAARRAPDVSFVWIGPGEPAARPEPANVRRLGPRLYAALPAYLQHADVGLIPFDRGRHRALVDGINPLKLYEYAAAGLPVVATPWPELRRIGGPVRFAEGAEAFAGAVRAAAASPKPVAAAQAFAAAASWRKRVDGLLAALDFS